MGHPDEEVARRAWNAYTERDLDEVAQATATKLSVSLGAVEVREN